ncbi:MULTISPECIES: hypothetical protein [Actinomycetes]|uniref:hypothetical protein n=1 Tax=Actinomycetes TaxID=1760 RepID=UPI00341EF9C2
MSIQDEEIQNDVLGEQFDLSCIEALAPILAPILARIPDMEPAVIAREARYLAINDLGKTVKGVDMAGREFDGKLINFNPKPNLSSAILLTVRGRFYGNEHYIRPQTPITITGKEQNK